MDISRYLVENWPLMASMLVEIILVIIFAVLKKKPVVKSLQEWCSHVFEYYGPAFMKSVEGKGLTGEQKKKEVISLLVETMKRFVSIDLIAVNDCEKKFGELIESALSCPQKKEL